MQLEFIWLPKLMRKESHVRNRCLHINLDSASLEKINSGWITVIT